MMRDSNFPWRETFGLTCYGAAAIAMLAGAPILLALGMGVLGWLILKVGT